MYAERRSGVAGAVLWTSDQRPTTLPTPTTVVLPDGCMDLIWIDGALLVAGPDTEPWTGPASAQSVTGLRFASGVGPEVLGVPADALRNTRVSLSELWPSSSVRRWQDQLARRDRSDDLGRALEALTGPILPPIATVAPIRRLARLCAAGRSVADLSAATGWSERTLHRRCLHSFGYGANTLTRVLRFRRATAWIAGGSPLADVADRAGYADQAHLSREVREFAGRSPTTFRVG